MYQQSAKTSFYAMTPFLRMLEILLTLFKLWLVHDDSGTASVSVNAKELGIVMKCQWLYAYNLFAFAGATNINTP